jgi:hypothetical protein
MKFYEILNLLQPSCGFWHVLSMLKIFDKSRLRKARRLINRYTTFLNVLALVVGFMGVCILLATQEPSTPSSGDTTVEHLASQLESLLATNDLDTTIKKFTTEAEAWAGRLDKQAKTDREFHQLQEAVRESQLLLSEKQNILTNIHQQIAVLSLNTNQLSLVQAYNQSLKHDVGFKEWFTKPLTWYEFGKSLVISSAFFALGRITNRKKRKVTSPKNRQSPSVAP